MAEKQLRRVLCPACQAVFSWSSSLAGRTVPCACGQRFKMPLTPQDAVERVSEKDNQTVTQNPMAGSLGAAGDVESSDHNPIPPIPPLIGSRPPLSSAGPVSKPGSISSSLPDRPLSILEMAKLDAKKFPDPNSDDEENPSNKSVGLESLDLGPGRPNDPFLAIQKNQLEDMTRLPVNIPPPAATGSSLKDEAEFFDLVIDDETEKFGQPKYKPGSPDRPLPSAGLPVRPAIGAPPVPKSPAPVPVAKPLPPPNSRPAGSVRPMDPGATDFPVSKAGSPPIRPGAGTKSGPVGGEKPGGTHFPPLGPIPNRAGRKATGPSNDLSSDLPPMPVMPPPIPPHLDPSSFMNTSTGSTVGPATSSTGLPGSTRPLPVVNPKSSKSSTGQGQMAFPVDLGPIPISKPDKPAEVKTGLGSTRIAPGIQKAILDSGAAAPATNPKNVPHAERAEAGSVDSKTKYDLPGGSVMTPKPASPPMAQAASSSTAPTGETAVPSAPKAPPASPADTASGMSAIGRPRSMPARAGVTMFPHLVSRPSSPNALSGISGVRPKTDPEPLGPIPNANPMGSPPTSTGLPSSALYSEHSQIMAKVPAPVESTVKVPMPENPVPDHMLPYEALPLFNPPPFVDERPLWGRMEIWIPVAVVGIVGLGLWVSYNFQMSVNITYVGRKPPGESRLVIPTTKPAATTQPVAPPSAQDGPNPGSGVQASPVNPDAGAKTPVFPLRSFVGSPPPPGPIATTQPSTKP